MDKDFEYYTELIRKRKLPKNFNQWLVKDEEGNALAHIAAKHKILPPNWTNKREDWLVKDSNGYTVAHIATYYGILRLDWTDKTEDWLVEDFWGETIAHYAAKKGILPHDWTDDPKDWLIKDKNGETIAHYAAEKRILPKDWTDKNEDWCIKNNNNETIGLLFCSDKKYHYNNPQTIEDYYKNTKDHLFPLTENFSKISNSKFIHVNNFLEPFIDIIKKQSQDDWMKSSDDYSGFLIDHVECIIDHLRYNLHFENIKGNNLRNLIQASEYIKDEKMTIKQHLFEQHESKNQSIIKDNKEPDFSDTL